MKILISGNGVMANIVKDCIKEPDVFAGMIDTTKDVIFNEDFDAIIDFSNHLATKKILEFAKNKNKPILIATTGHSIIEEQLIEEYSKYIYIIKATNTSLGVFALNRLAKLATQLLENFDIEIIEKHHNRKIDAPSGTAKTLAKNIKDVRSDLEIVTNRTGKRNSNELGIHSVRAGNIFGEHSVIFAAEDEIIEIKHTAFSRKIFAIGAIKLAHTLLEKKQGLFVYE
ncbi:4-hydroxy-tetrahydrodipicolinate reductase [Caviibacter abscessus]|uniref:4-hydroxy-tetrahydrodipicolinate reductase n=1 Tax=Caviibacter abscessus TaxID=1766719 RepID=UPI00083030F4|nr:4-hydroxy-tetrahydrodipicolinate reductase [Caviibacter abscessus]